MSILRFKFTFARCSRIAWLFAFVLALLPGSGRASTMGGVAVRISLEVPNYVEDETVSASLSGTFLPSTPTGSDVAVTATHTSNLGDSARAALSYSASMKYVRVEPFKSYTIQANGSNEGQVTVSAPPGYRVKIDGEYRATITVSWTTFTLMLVPTGIPHAELAGMVSSVAGDKIQLSISLGNRSNGTQAGELVVAHSGYDNDWSALLSPASLHYTGPNSEAQMVNNAIYQVVTGSVYVRVVAVSGGYEIRCYSNPFVNPWGGPAFVTYRVERASSGSLTSVKFTREFREVTVNNATNPATPISRSESMAIERTGTWPNCTWTRTSWTPAGGSPLIQTTYASTGSGQSRAEAISVASGSTTAFQAARNYSIPTTGEILASETVGTGTPSPATGYFDYYQDPALPNFGHVKSAVLPGGKWASFDYYLDEDGYYGPRGGQIKYRYAPFIESPSAVSFSASQGEATYFEYARDPWGAWTTPALVETRVTGVLKGKSSTTVAMNESTGSLDMLSLRTTRRDYNSPTAYLQNESQEFVSGPIPGGSGYRPAYAGLPAGNNLPDGSSQAYGYHWGTFDGTTFTAGPGPLGSGDQNPSQYLEGTVLRRVMIAGRTDASAPGSTQLGAGGEIRFFLGALYVVDGKSTKQIEIIDRGRLVKTESYVWSSGVWKLTSWVKFNYDFVGRLIGKETESGTVYNATWDGDRRMSETDENGVVTHYTYDSAGRLIQKRREASGPIAELKTRFTYDAIGNVVEENTGPDSGERIVVSRTYDTAGRIATETQPGKGPLTHSYQYHSAFPWGTSHTVTRPKPFAAYPGTDGGTIVETTYLDGRPKSRAGTSAVPSVFSYGYETDGRLWTRTDHGVEVGTSSPRWSKVWQDWGGRKTRSERPGFNAGPNIVEESNFNLTAGQWSTGKPYRTTRPNASGSGLLVERVDYDPFGRPFRTGLDLGDNGLLPSSSDRISESATTFETIDQHLFSNSSAYIYPTEGSGTAVLVSAVRKRLTGLTSGQLEETRSTDADGNVSTAVRAVNRTTRITTVTTTRTGVANPQLEKFENGVATEVTGHDGIKVTTLYDALNRPWKKVEQRNGKTAETTYVAGTSLVANVKEKANTGSPITVATFSYDALGRTTAQTNAAGKTTHSAYSLRDQPIRQWGAATYPVAYAYNTFGEKVAMRTFRNPTQDFTTATWPLTDDGGDAYNPNPASWTTGDKTTWAFDAATGLLAGKTDATGKTVSYTYNAALQLATREWARTVASGANAGQRVKATYTYSATTGDQTGITYNDGTPALVYAYTRLAQIDTVQDATSASAADLRDFSYDPSYPHRLVGETLNGFFGDRALTRLYATTGMLGRYRGFKLGSAVGSNAELEQTYGYSATTARFETLTSSREANAASRTFRYAYLANSHLVESLAVDVGAGPGGHPFTIARTFEDHRDVLTSVEAKWGSNPGNSRTKFAYVSNALVQRQSAEQSGDVFTGYSTGTIHHAYTYNDRSEVTQGLAKLGPVASPGGLPRQPPARVRLRRHRQPEDHRRDRPVHRLPGPHGQRSQPILLARQFARPLRRHPELRLRRRWQRARRRPVALRLGC